MRAKALALLWVAALAAVPAVAEEPPDGFEAAVARAEEARRAGDLEQAVLAFRRALELRPDWDRGHWALGTLLHDLDRHAETVELLGAWLTDHPDDAVARALNGLCEFHMGRQEAALADLQRALALGVPPGLESTARLQSALLVNRLGNPDAALELLRPLAHQGQDAIPVIQAFGLALLRMPLLPSEVPEDKRDMVLLAGRGAYRMARTRRNDTGRLALEELVSRYPAEPNVHYALGLYLQPEEPDRAAREFRRELEISPDNYVAMLQLASMELRRGDLDTALEMSERAFGLAPESPATHLMLGRSLLQAGQTERAIELLEAGARMAPQSHEFQFALARAYRRADRPEDAARADRKFQELKALRDGEGAPSGTSSGH